MILAFLAALGAIVVALVLYPVFTDTADELSRPREGAKEYRELAEKKARLYEGIQDLDFEKDQGKVSQNDYEAARNDYLAQVAAVIEKMDALAPKAEEKPSRAETKPPSKKKSDKKPRCRNCGKSNPEGSKFCFACGKPFGLVCKSCGEGLPGNAKFCNACGEKVTP